MSTSTAEATISIVCVYNDLQVRRECLDRSIDELADEADGVEYIPVENIDGTHASAGAALNHGTSLASNDVMVFVHQDVFLHSLTALKRAAGQMQGAGFGLLGAVGVRADGALVGRVRDRVPLAGELVAEPVDIDSVDEVLFMVPRSQLGQEPLTESPDLAWHAYAVEYGLRVRKAGLRAGVANMPLTHNSLSTNLARLTNAHQAVARLYPDLLPVTTTCGTVSRDLERGDRRPWLSSQRWRYRWLRESLAIRPIARTVRPDATVLADLRHDIDDVLDRAPGQRIHVVNCSGDHPFAKREQNSVELRRREGTVVFSDHGIGEIPDAAAKVPDGSWTLVTNLTGADIELLWPQLSATPRIVGYHSATQPFIMLGAALAELPPYWRSARATPLGVRRQ